MDENRNQLPWQIRQPARIGSAIFILANWSDDKTGKPLAQMRGFPENPRVIREYEGGGALSLCSYSGELEEIWGRARKYYKYDPQHVSWVVRWEYDGEYSRELAWIGSMELLRLVAKGIQIVGPYIGHPYYVAYAKIKDAGEYKLAPHGMLFPRFTPELFPGFFSFGEHDLDFDALIKVCQQLLDAFEGKINSEHHRWQSDRTSDRKGTRLQASLELYSQAMRFIYAQDTCMRLHIALEALFACRAFNKSTLAILCPLLLRHRTAPKTVLQWVLSIYQWRNAFFHGDEPPYQDPSSAAHMDILNCATGSGISLLKELYLEILGSAELMAIFNARPKDEEFMESLFKVLVDR